MQLNGLRRVRDERARERSDVTVRRPHPLGEIAIVLLLVFAYDRVKDLATANPAAAVAHGLALLHLERLGHLNVELPYNLWLSAHDRLAHVASWYYQLAHITVTLLILLACYVLRPERYRGARNALLMINLVGLVMFWLVPTAPPRLLPGSGFVDTTIMTGVAGAHSTPPDPYAAMPSLHTAWAVWSMVVVWGLVRSRWAKALWACYPVLTGLVIVGTGNHYLADVLAGGILAGVVLGVQAVAVRRRPRERQALPSG